MVEGKLLFLCLCRALFAFPAFVLLALMESLVAEAGCKEPSHICWHLEWALTNERKCGISRLLMSSIRPYYEDVGFLTIDYQGHRQPVTDPDRVHSSGLAASRREKIIYRQVAL